VLDYVTELTKEKKVDPATVARMWLHRRLQGRCRFPALPNDQL